MAQLQIEIQETDTQAKVIIFSDKSLEISDINGLNLEIYLRAGMYRGEPRECLRKMPTRDDGKVAVTQICLSFPNQNCLKRFREDLSSISL